MPQHKRLGDLEQQVMEFLWKHGPAKGEEVRAAVGRERSLTDSTIRTVLRRLEAKQYVRHETQDRQFVYSSVREPRKVAAEAVLGILKKFCRGSLEELLSGLVDHRVVDERELQRLAERIAKTKKAEANLRRGRKS